MWASDVRCLNDKDEVTHGIKILTEILDQSYSGVTGVYGKSIGWLRQSVTNIFELMRVFACCFCEEDDVNSQWNTYAKEGGGFSLGFNAHMRVVHPMFAVVPQSFERVRYKEHEKRAFLEEPLQQVRQVLEAVAPTAEAYDSLFGRAAGSKLAAEIAQRLAVVKNRSFISEFEWRFVYADSANEPILPVISAVGDTPVKPHVELRLRGNDPEYDDRLPIIAVVRGALPAPQLTLAQGEELLRDYGYPTSRVEFRESQSSLTG
jgi:hypothetical protein